MITLTSINLFQGAKCLLDEASTRINPKEKIGLIGKNGCGKSTLLALILGKLTVDSGDISIPKHWQIATMVQEIPLIERSALDYVIDGDQEYRRLEQKLMIAEQQNQGEQIAHLHHDLEHIDGYRIHSKAAILLDGLGFASTEINNPIASFSGGWQMRLNLAQALLCRSDLLLLDEPTNHLDLNTVIWLESWLKNYQGTLVIISHDRDFLDPVVNKIIHIEQKKLNEYSGNYSAFELMRAQKLSQQQSLFEKQQDQVAHMHKYIERFRYKASKAKQAQSRLKALDRMELLLPAQLDNPFSFEFRQPHALPNPILSIEKVKLGYDETVILENIHLNLVPGSRIGLLGQNGAGKSTLIKLLSGDLQPIAGSIRYSQGVKIGYFAQHQLETLRPDDSALNHLSILSEGKHTELELRSFLGQFAFQGDKALEPIRHFSGGEKSRLVLALILWQRPNLLLLDEPTNHLDLDMRQALTIALQSFEGAMILVSHDRYLLRATTDEFYLVAHGQVSPFNDDLDGYYQWTLSQQREHAIMRRNLNTTEDQTQSNGLTNDKTETEQTNVNRKQQKQLEALIRQKTAPIRKEIENAEQQVNNSTKQLTEIELQLNDSALYQEQNKSKLQSLLQQQGQIKQELTQVETHWFELQEALEKLEIDLLAQ